MTFHLVMWLWRGWRPVYDRRDVACLVRQLKAYGDLPSDTRLVLLTDRPTDWEKPKLEAMGVLELPLWDELPGLNMGHPRLTPMYPFLPQFKGKPNCYKRLKIFDPETQAALGIKPGDIIMSMDLDSVVWASLQPLVSPFFNGINPTDFMAMAGRVSRIHGSLFAFRAGTNTKVWTEFDPGITPSQLRNPGPRKPRYIGSDQAWMSTILGDVPLWGPEHGVYSYGLHHPVLRPKDPITYMSFAGPNKPRSVNTQIQLPWVYEHAMAHWEP